MTGITNTIELYDISAVCLLFGDKHQNLMGLGSLMMQQQPWPEDKMTLTKTDDITVQNLDCGTSKKPILHVYHVCQIYMHSVVLLTGNKTKFRVIPGTNL